MSIYNHQTKNAQLQKRCVEVLMLTYRIPILAGHKILKLRTNYSNHIISSSTCSNKKKMTQFVTEKPISVELLRY